MATKDFQSYPTFEQVADRVVKISEVVRDHAEFNESSGQLIETLLKNVAEINLKLIFLMNLYRIEHFTSSVIDPSTGKRPSEIKTAEQLYREGGREAIQQQLETLREAVHAEGVHAEGADETQPAVEDNGQVGTVTFPNLITH